MLFNNPNKVKLAIGAFLLVAIVAWATTAHSAERTLTFSGGRTIVRAETTVADLAVSQPRFVGDAALEAGITLIGDSTYGTELVPNYLAKNAVFPLPVKTMVEVPRHQAGNIAARLALVDGFGNFDIGLGAVWMQHADYLNGSNLNFCLLLGYRWQHLQLRYQHISNAGTSPPNVGRDMVLLGWRF